MTSRNTPNLYDTHNIHIPSDENRRNQQNLDNSITGVSHLLTYNPIIINLIFIHLNIIVNILY